jgi:polyketide biosynthesis acyl carrier protein
MSAQDHPPTTEPGLRNPHREPNRIRTRQTPSANAHSATEHSKTEIAMTLEEIFATIVGHTREILPGLDDHAFQFSDSLRELGANSIDRSEVVMLTLESLSLKAPMIEFAKAENMGELATLLHARL